MPTSQLNLNYKNIRNRGNSLKNFLYFLCFYNLLANHNQCSVTSTKPTIMSFPKYTKKFTLLRAPFRHKLSKKNYTLIRYKSSVVLKFDTNNIKVDNLCTIIDLINSLLKHVYWFETNVQYLHRINITLSLLCRKYKL